MNNYHFDFSLRFRHPSMDPDFICQKLRMEPKYKYKAGEQRKTPKGRFLPGLYEETYCTFPLPAAPDQDLEGHISCLNASLLEHRALFEEVSSSGGRIEYFVGLYADNNAGLEITDKIMSELVDLNINLQLDIYTSSGKDRQGQ